MPAAPSSAQLQGAATLAQVNAGGAAVLVASDSGLLSVNETNLTPVALVAYSGEPATTGGILALTPRDGGVLLVATNGVYHSDGDRLVRSPASDTLANLAVYSLDDVIVDHVERSWFGGDGAVYQLQQDTLRRWDLGATGPVNAVRESDGRVLAAIDSTLFELTLADDSVRQIDHPFGPIHQIARGRDGALLLATGGGAVVQDAAGGFIQHTLSDGEAVAASAVDYDHLAGAVFATDIGIVRLLDGQISGVAPSVGGTAKGLSIDLFGDVWLSHDQQLTGLFVGHPLSFDSAVKPLISDHCTSCHENPTSGAPQVDFRDHQTAVNWSDRIVARVTDPLNPMPPASAPPLDQNQIDTFVRWYATGTAP